MSENSPKNKWWFRLLRVIFTIAFLGVLAGALTAVFIEGRPTTDYYQSKYSYKCNNGEIHGDFSYLDLSNTSYYMESLDNVDLKDVNSRRILRFVCSNPNFFNTLSEQDKFKWINQVYDGNIENIPITKNYEIIFKNEKIDGSWGGFVGKLIAALWGPVIAFAVIRYIFYYIVFGQYKYIFNEL